MHRHLFFRGMCTAGRQGVVIDMLDDDMDHSTRSQLMKLTPSGDLLDLAREMREMGVETLLFCRPGGQIDQVVTDRHIAHLAASAAPPAPVESVPGQQPDDSDPAEDLGAVRREPAVPPQGARFAGDRHPTRPVPLTRT